MASLGSRRALRALKILLNIIYNVFSHKTVQETKIGTERILYIVSHSCIDLADPVHYFASSS